ncbi:UDP-N-acetylmuramoylalanyl-D-glutamate--2,6-diaminopimelate ligase, partial [Gammaproteobacteria bacterium]|nr:UDP-N-acetylmuramoylalanyl-D-glutamate--2,6-diaminopimelate ligase [Gammaproteobacteria bacterium]
DIPAHVIIDYAHNPEGFRFFLSSIKEYFENLIIVFGCGGDRDKSKRPKMLKAAIDNGNRVIFTTDNSRNESFSDIYSDAINQNNDQKVTVIEDRKEAIIYGSSILRKNDCLVILGKGHEETQDINGKKLHFSDHEVVNEIYK